MPSPAQTIKHKSMKESKVPAQKFSKKAPKLELMTPTNDSKKAFHMFSAKNSLPSGSFSS